MKIAASAFMPVIFTGALIDPEADVKPITISPVMVIEVDPGKTFPDVAPAPVIVTEAVMAPDPERIAVKAGDPL